MIYAVRTIGLAVLLRSAAAIAAPLTPTALEAKFGPDSGAAASDPV